MNHGMQIDDTIVAVASAPGLGGRGIVRISGPESLAIIDQLTANPGAQRSSRARGRAMQVDVILPVAGSEPVTCQATMLGWPDQRSYTGQISAELHLNVPEPVLEYIVQRCHGLGARLARPGEFTLRGFLAGRMDLTQAEAVMGLIHAADSHQFHTALEQLAGGLATPFAAIREELLLLLADLEAGLDFVEEDIEFISRESLVERLEIVQYRLSSLRDQVLGRSRTDSSEIVLVGFPNVGKSSLYNRLTESESAIVSSHHGTTRDWLTKTVQMGSQQFRITDTAGIDSEEFWRSGLEPPVNAGGGQFPAESAGIGEMSGSSIEQLSGRQTMRAMQRAALVLVCVDAASPAQWESGLAAMNRLGRRGQLVATRSDLAHGQDIPSQAVGTSAVTGAGLAELRKVILEKISLATHNGFEVVPATLLRCTAALQQAAGDLAETLAAARNGAGEEVVAAGIRLVLDAVGEISGAVCNEDVLDRVFSRFCIGK